MLDGRVQKSGKKVQITVQRINEINLISLACVKK